MRTHHLKRRLPLNKLVQVETSRCCATKLSLVFNTEPPCFATYVFTTEGKRAKFKDDLPVAVPRNT